MASPAEWEQAARAALPADVYDYIATGSGVEETLAGNDRAWHEVALRPRVLRDVSDVETATSVLGTPVASPVLVAPTGYHRLAHPDGEVATAKGTAEAGSLFVLSTRATASLDEVAAVAGPWWMQHYLLRDRDLTAEIVRGAVDAGARALVLTADTPYVATKARVGAVPVGPSVPRLVPAMETRDDEGTWQDPAVTFKDIGWLRELSGGLPVVVKGVLRGDDARACVDAGAAAVWVSNHGARQLDGAIPTAVALPQVRAAVGEACEVYVDGGIRTGRDVVRALALGATAAFVGRPALWALGTGGADGVRELLTSLQAEVAETLALCGCRSVSDVNADLAAVPPGRAMRG
ncbi:alpha-hydroxy acid oxidase [Actinopolymorpha sp. B9G3]|uniref:alpha-hydroxy acid oxidase n=1 Tax=Actinopolymorpha sp. B9G3 TaxID=3158970 RepID=UPI0032D8CAB5